LALGKVVVGVGAMLSVAIVALGKEAKEVGLPVTGGAVAVFVPVTLPDVATP
jgi:hypothetical protein